MFQRDRVGVADRSGQFERGQLFQRQQRIDAEMTLVIERRGVGVGRGVDAGHDAAGPECLGHRRADDVHFVVAGNGQAHVRPTDIGAEQDRTAGGVADDCADVQFAVDLPHFVRVGIDHGDAVPAAAQHIGDPATDRAGTEQQNPHQSVRGIRKTNGAGPSTRRSPT